MAQPIQEPTSDRELEGLAFRSRQLFRRPSVPDRVPDAAFIAAVPHYDSAEGQQRLETPRDWTTLEISPTIVQNRDQLTGGDAISLVTPAGGVGKRIVFNSFTEAQYLSGVGWQYWVLGARAWIGSWFSDDFVNWTEWYDTDAVTKMHQVALGLNADGQFRHVGTEQLVTEADGRYGINDQVPVGNATGIGGCVAPQATCLLDPSEIAHDPNADPENQAGIEVQVWHNVDWDDDEPALKGPPATLGGEVWGFRYTIGLYDT